MKIYRLYYQLFHILRIFNVNSLLYLKNIFKYINTKCYLQPPVPTRTYAPYRNDDNNNIV